MTTTEITKVLNSQNKTSVTVTHYADPWCWWSWGLEPVIARLREVYQDQIKVVYRMGGMAATKRSWLQANGVDDQSLTEWLKQSIELTRNPVDLGYFDQSGFESSYPAALSVVAAKQQDETLANRYFRRLVEAFQVEARPATERTIREVATEVGINADHMVEFASTIDADAAFAADQEAMRRSGANFMTLVIEGNGRSIAVGDSFNSQDYERVIDELVPGLSKRQPSDILEYMEKVAGHFISAKEIAEAFQIPAESARVKLIRLENSGAVLKVIGEVPDLWKFVSFDSDRFTEEIIRTSHVTPGGAISDGGLESVVRSAVQTLYTRVAADPESEFHFPPGVVSAMHVGYSTEELARIPATAVESFAGVGYPFFAKVITPGDTVLEIGSGSGTDALLAATLVGESGSVTGLDLTPAMIAKARANIELSRFSNVRIVEGEATDIPVDDDQIDVVTSNGVLNLVVDKSRAFAEIFRVVKSGGWLQIADIVSDTSVAGVCGINPQLWADCVGGAATETEFVELLMAAGFVDVEILDTRDYFKISDSETTRKLTKTFGVRSQVVRARKP